MTNTAGATLGTTAIATGVIRFDIDPANEPDIVGSMLDMAAVESESVDAIFSAHNIEHVYPYQ